MVVMEGFQWMSIGEKQCRGLSAISQGIGNVPVKNERHMREAV